MYWGLWNRGNYTSALRLAEWTARQAAFLRFASADTIWLRWHLADAYRCVHRYAEAIPVYEQLLTAYSGSNSPHEGVLRLRVATCLEQAGREAEAQTERLRGLELIPDSQRTYDVFQAQGEVYVAQKRYAEAAMEYENALNALRGDARYSWERLHLLSNLAHALVYGNRYEEAFPWTEQALAVAAELPSETANLYLGYVYFQRACIFGERRNLPAAEQAARAGLARAEESADERLRDGMLTWLVWMVGLQGRRAEAEKIIADRIAPGDSSETARTAFLCRGLLHAVYGEAREAVAAYAQAAVSGEDDDQIGTSLRNAAEFVEFAPEEALRILNAVDRESASEREVMHLRLLQTRALAACGAEDASRGFAELVQYAAAQEMDPELGIASREGLYGQLAEIALLLSDAQAASMYLDKLSALPTTPVYAPLTARLWGDLHTLQGDFTAARAKYEEAVAFPLKTEYSEQARQRLAALSSENASDPPANNGVARGTDR
jgi:predicted negative regulator of RcsB-dependent stress response